MQDLQLDINEGRGSGKGEIMARKATLALAMLPLVLCCPSSFPPAPPSFSVEQMEGRWLDMFSSRYVAPDTHDQALVKSLAPPLTLGSPPTAATCRYTPLHTKDDRHAVLLHISTQ